MPSWTWLCVRPLSLPVAAVEKAKAEERDRDRERRVQPEGVTCMSLGIPTWAEYRSGQVEVSMAA